MHIPVLLHEVLEGLALKKGGIYVDCTVNRAGHAIEIAKHIGRDGTLVIFDLDSDALHEATEKLSHLADAPTVIPILGNFRTVRHVLKEHQLGKVDGLLADLGLSSQELDSAARGFSFRFDEPLLMTFQKEVTEESLTAKDIVNTWAEETIADILYGFADETYSRRIARAIVQGRQRKPITTTFELVKIIEEAVPFFYRRGKTHYATKTFQALRMATNDELGAVTELIQSLPEILKEGAHACVITFHSTEDRTVKHLMRDTEGLKLITKKAILPTREECINNPRARSAQLRIAEAL